MAHITSYLFAAAAAEPPSDATSPPFFLCGERATSARQAASRVAGLAAGLMQQLGVQVGDRVCVAALATDAHLEALLAVAAAGGIAAPLNWRWGGAEAASAARLVGARMLLADAACLRFALTTAAAAGPGAIQALVLLGPPSDFRQEELAAAPPGLALAFAEALADGCPDASLALRCAPGNAALVVFTSGTTGRPKGVTLSHAALHCQSMAKLLECGYSSRDVYLHAAPFFHIGGLSSAIAMLAARARHVFLPRFDGAALLAAIRQHGVTAFIAVPAMVADLLAAAEAAAVRQLPSVSRVLVGGGGMPPALQRGLAALCPAATVHTAYGMTEGASSLTFATLWGPGQAGPPPEDVCTPASDDGGPAGGVPVGRPPPGIELAVLRAPGGAVGGSDTGSSTGSVCLDGQGEVLTRGPHVMLGYWDDDDATAAAQLPGGWLRTGDLGCLRQGQLWLMGRAKDMIKSGGENVHAWEVERALARHPGVAAAAVVGAADWRLGEAVAAAVVLRRGWRWRGPRCQVLLASAAQRQAGRAALEAAAAAVAPHSGAGAAVLGHALSGEDDAGGEGEAEAAAGCGAGGVMCVEDLRSTLLQRSPSRPGSAQSVHSGDGGGLLVSVPLSQRGGQRSSLPDVLQQLAGVAAGLQRVAAAAERRQGGGGTAGEEERVVDGRTLQQHCRDCGLAGFKLPRVFLLCDAAAAAPAPAGSSAVLLPLNASGKVVKHLLRQQVQQHMASAAGDTHAGDGSGRPRPRL